MQCQRCFYVDNKLGVARPPGFPFNLNSAVDELFKREFDSYRAKGESHPLMKSYGLDAVPYAHEKLDEWRDALRKGIQYTHEPTGLIIRGGVDDVWIGKDKKLIIVDYKATSKKSEVTLDAEWQDGYKRQMEIYQWLFRKNGFEVSDTGYFVYANADSDKESFDAKLEFDVKLIPYTGNDAWVEGTIYELYKVLTGENVPDTNPECDYCNYKKATQEVVPQERKKKPEGKKGKEATPDGSLF